MAAPSHTSRPSPAGIQLPNGFSAEIVFALLPTASFWAQGLKPSAINGGEPIPQSTHHNILHHTSAPRALIKREPLVINCAYDPNLRAQMQTSLINKPGSITIFWGDQSYEDFYGFLFKAEFSELKEGELPMVTLTVEVSNYDPVNHIEVGPTYTNVAGT